MTLSVYLSGEIHTDWRDEIKRGAKDNGLDIIFSSPVTDHDASDAAGDHLGKEPDAFWRDHKSSKVNAVRTKTLIDKSDLVVIRFGDRYKQWNAAYDAGYCAAIDKPYITLHGDDIVHPLKEVDAGAKAWATSTSQVIDILKYITRA